MGRAGGGKEGDEEGGDVLEEEGALPSQEGTPSGTGGAVRDVDGARAGGVSEQVAEKAQAEHEATSAEAKAKVALKT
eukprot:scaffold107775_cov21-Phaeocystis_antarctica.AAC.1